MALIRFKRKWQGDSSLQNKSFLPDESQDLPGALTSHMQRVIVITKSLRIKAVFNLEDPLVMGNHVHVNRVINQLFSFGEDFRF